MMKKILAFTLLLAACGSEIKSKDGVVGNNGTTTNNETTTNNKTTTNNGTDNNGVTSNSNNTGSTTSGEDCGNGVLDVAEECEGFEFRIVTCESEGFVSGSLLCNDKCRIDTSECSSCGDGIINGADECDGEDLGDATCANTAGAETVGPLTCSNICEINTQECEPIIQSCEEYRTCDDACDLIGGTESADAQRCRRVCQNRTPAALLETCGDGD